MSDFEINGTPVHKLRVADLKEELGARGLSKSGKKDELIARLVSYLEVNGQDEEGKSVDNIEEGSSDSRDDMIKKWQEEREQLLKENELRRQEEERRESEQEEEAKQIEEQKRLQEQQAQAKEEEKKRLKEQQAKDEERKIKEAAEEKRLAEERKLKEAEERRQKEEKMRLQKEEEKKRLKEEEAMKKQQEEKQQAELKAKKEKEEAEKKRIKEEKQQAELKAKKEKEEAEKRKADDEKMKAKEIEAKKDVSGSDRKEDESLILETAADDTLVMEIEQADIVTEETEAEMEKKSEDVVIPAEPGQVTSLRRLGGGRQGQGEDRKRGWGASKVTNGGSAPVSISSDSLKDIVPDLKPLMDSTEAVMEPEEGETVSVESDPDVAGPKVPDAVKKDKEEPIKKKKRITLTEDEKETSFLLITNLTRPFTVNSFKEMLKRTGTIDDFWIDRIKSTCCVQFSNNDQASETKMALNGVTWPVGNPKTLRVSFTTEDQMKKYKETADGVLKPSGDHGDRMAGVREWDRDKGKVEERDRDREDRRQDRDRREVRMRELSAERSSPQAPTKSLEELFRKTSTTPAIYWKPLTEEQVKHRVELRNKRLMEAKIMREMEDTKETLQRSKKLISGGSPP